MKNSKDNNLLCIACYKERKTNCLPDAYFKDKEKLTSETQEKACGGGHAYLDNCSISELQSIHQEITKNKIVTKKVVEVKHHVVAHESVSLNSNCAS